MEKIKFGQEGWKGIIAKDFTIHNVSRIAHATARWLSGTYTSPSAVIGYDCRFGGEMFMEAVAKILASKNIRVYISESFVSTPMVSLGVLKLKAQCGIMITASHSPAAYHGILLKGSQGETMQDKDIRDIENLITSEFEIDLDLLNWNQLLEQGLIQYFNLESVYIKNIHEHFDLELLNNNGQLFALDAMYGSAQNICKKLFPKIRLFGCEQNPTFLNIPPDPSLKNLHFLAEYITKNKEIICSLALDGDGDRIALFDEKSNYLDSHHILLLLIYYFLHYKKLKGKIVVNSSITGKVEKLCSQYGIEVIRTPLGFSEISRIMEKESILLGAEESGGITIDGSPAEKDGLFIGLTIWFWLLESGKKLGELLEEVIQITGNFACDRVDIEYNKALRNRIIDKCKSSEFKQFGDIPVIKSEDTDGYKYFLNENRWIIIRTTVYEPMIQIYVEAENYEIVKETMNSVINTLNQS